MKHIRGLCLLLVVGGMLVGCVTHESTPKPIWTKTHTSSPTLLQSDISTSTPRPIQTATLTPPVTLEPGQVIYAVKTLLHEDVVDCDAPCFWGILPGKTTFGEAKNIFIRLGLDLRFTVAEDNKEYYGAIYNLDNNLRIVPNLTVQDNIVKSIKIGISPREQGANAVSESLMYSPEALIERYGSPSKVNFVVDWGPQSFFEMDIYFDRFDLIAQYTVYGYIENTFPKICPLKVPFEYISLWMGKDPLYPPTDIVLLEKGTSLSLEQFAKLMTSDSNKACFTLDEKAFQ